jgi:hypothetical protein
MIHAAAMPSHLREWWLAGAFFAGIGVAEFCLGFLALSVESRRLWLLAAGLSIATMAVWAFSRLWGMPIGPRAWHWDRDRAPPDRHRALVASCQRPPVAIDTDASGGGSASPQPGDRLTPERT